MSNRPTKLRYVALAWLTVASALAYLCRNTTGVAESAVREELNLTLEQSGWFMGAFFWSYAIFQVPGGWMSERLGTRVALSLFAIMWSAAMLGTGLAPGFWLLIVAQLTMGVAQAGVLPASCNSIGYWMPLSQRSLACGILGAGMQVGAIVASGLAGLLMISIGWRTIFVAFAIPGVIWTIGFLARFRDDPAEVLPADSSELALIRAGRPVDESPATRKISELEELLALARIPTIWWLCGQQICRSAGYMFFASWFPTFLQVTRGVSVEQSGYLQSFVLTGSLTGVICGGMLTDWVWRRTGNLRLSRSGVGAASLGACSVVILVAWFAMSLELVVALMALGAFLAAFAGPCAFAATIDIGGPRVPQVFGVVNMSGNFAAAICPVLVGVMFQWTSNWNVILLMFAGVFLAGAACWVFVNPQRRVR
jgi:ACS family D-galactonate transporter-like MFS transporter